MKLHELPLAIARGAAAWPLPGQYRSRRNALVASALLLERRADRLDTEEFLRSHAAESVGLTGAVADASG